MNLKEKIRIELVKTLSGKPYIYRTDKNRQTIDGCSAGALANMDCAGTGPKDAFLIGNKIAYPIPSYIDWVVSRCEVAPGRSSDAGR